MKNFRRKLLELSSLSIIILPYYLLYAVTKKIINPDLTEDQKRFCNNGLCLIFKPEN